MEISLLLALLTGSLTVLSYAYKILKSINDRLGRFSQMAADVNELKQSDKLMAKQVTYHEIFMVRNFKDYIPFANKNYDI